MVEIEVDRSFRAAVPAALKAGQSLVWDGSGPMIVYDDKGRKVTEAAIGQALPPLGKGQHSIAIDARFAGADPVLKGTVKLEAAAEAIGRRRRTRPPIRRSAWRRRKKRNGSPL